MKEKKLKKTLTSKKVLEKPQPVVQTASAENKEAVLESYLSREDHQALENATNAAEKARMGMALQEQVLVNKKLEKELADRAIEDAQKLLTAKSHEYTTRSKSAGEFIRSLTTKYKIAGSFQYDPVSGRIIR